MLIVIDGTNLVRRMYHAGGSMSLDRTAERLERDYGGNVVVAWDAKHPYWRHELWPDYKAHRAEDPQASAFVRAAARECRTLGLRGYYAEGMEADDIAATLVARNDEESIVVTSDKDWCQLLADGARWLAPERGGFEERTANWVWDRYHIGPELWPDYVALAGDPSDGIPGAKSIGPKRAADRLRHYGSLEAYMEAMGFAEDAKTTLRTFRTIATLRTDADLKEFA